jgi:hypothetical protein
MASCTPLQFTTDSVGGQFIDYTVRLFLVRFDDNSNRYRSRQAVDRTPEAALHRLCRPEFGANSTCSFDVGLTYIEDYSCSKEGNSRLLYDARKSFPSGHSSLAAYAAVYLGYYFHRRLSSQSTLLLKLVLQMVLCCLALFTALSRVTDNKHHWSDVTVGALIGVLVGAWMILFIRKTVRWGIHAITSDVESGGIVLVTPTDQTQQQPAPVVMVTADDIHSNTTKQIDEPMKLALCQPVTYGHVDHNDQLSLRVAAGMSRGD